MIKLLAITVLIRGAGEMATGVAWRLKQANFRVVLLERPEPLAVRRGVAFSEAVFDGIKTVEGVTATRISEIGERETAWKEGNIPLLVDPEMVSLKKFRPKVLVDAILAKKSLGLTRNLAPLVIALGPGFRAGIEANMVVETNRGHHLGRLILSGEAEGDTGVPGNIGGFTKERVLRAPGDGIFETDRKIGEKVAKEELVGQVEGRPVQAAIEGVLRGLIRPGIRVFQGLKVGDIDPRGRLEYCTTISEKARAIAGGVLEGILREFN